MFIKLFSNTYSHKHFAHDSKEFNNDFSLMGLTMRIVTRLFDFTIFYDFSLSIKKEKKDFMIRT